MSHVCQDAAATDAARVAVYCVAAGRTIDDAVRDASLTELSQMVAVSLICRGLPLSCKAKSLIRAPRSASSGNF
jgi:hypothetical protein